MTQAQRLTGEVPSLGLHVWAGQARAMPADHAHGDVEINFSQTGRFRYVLGGEVVTIPPGRVGVFWAALPHRLLQLTPPDATCWWITLPLEVLLGWSLPHRFVRVVLGGRMLVERRTVEGDAARFGQWAADFAQGQASHRADTAALEVQARLRRMAMEHGWTTVAQRRRRDDDAVPREDDPAQRMARFIARRYNDAIAVVDVARHVGLHPNYAMNLFRKSMGMTLNAYLTRQRVAHAQRLLATTDRDILDIGYDAGFGSTSRFYDAFGRITGRSPKAYRDTLRPRRSGDRTNGRREM